MIKNFSLAIGITALIAASGLALTNPTNRSDYSQYAVTEINRRCNQASVLLSIFCNTLVTINRNEIENFISGRTRRYNLVILSVWNTQTYGNNSITVIGVAGNYISLP
jgi:hypothetical protein